MTRTKLYSELFNRYNRERRQFFLDCREEMDYFVTVLCIVWICCFDSRNFSFLCFETKDSLLCGKYNLYIIYTGDVYNNCMD